MAVLDVPILKPPEMNKTLGAYEHHRRSDSDFRFETQNILMTCATFPRRVCRPFG
jgi:hypothetical protein